MSPPGDPIIRFEHVTYQYAAAESFALQDVSLQIQEGEYVALMGLNGSGKTTLELCINGIIPNMIMGDLDGSVIVAGMDTADYPVREMAKVVGMVFDNPEFQMSQMTVAEEVALGLENLGIPYDEMTVRIAEALRTVDLVGMDERMPLALSGGQQQRLAIASVLAMRPRILVMDEPTSNLDPLGKQEVFEIAARLNREVGMTVIMAEHEVEVMAEYADRVIVLDQGRIVANGTPREVFSQIDLLRRIGLRPPQATELAIALRNEFDAWSGPLPVNANDAVEAIETRFEVLAR